MSGSRAPPGRCCASGAAHSSRSAAPAGESRPPSLPSASSVNAAVAAFTKCLADRGKTEGVRVNCIHPSIVETDRMRRRIKAEIERTGAPEQKIREQLLRDFNNPIRVGTVEDVGNLVAFLVSSRASWLHGATIDLDGGEIPVL